MVTTTEKKTDAEKIAEKLIESRYVGCVQILGPISSLYWWNKKIERAQEWICLIKTSKDLYKKIEQLIKSFHTYETPEIISIPIAEGSDDYIKWLMGALKKD